MKPDEFLRRLVEWSRVPRVADRLTNAVILAASRHVLDGMPVRVLVSVELTFKLR
jgi:hypothetical protein